MMSYNVSIPLVLENLFWDFVRVSKALVTCPNMMIMLPSILYLHPGYDEPTRWLIQLVIFLVFTSIKSESGSDYHHG